jgi:DNA-directed RNA polymerase specialized sigma24 family protein
MPPFTCIIKHTDKCCQGKPQVDLREAVVLRFYQNLSFEEIAAIMDASLRAVKMRVSHGVEKLKGLMDEERAV